LTISSAFLRGDRVDLTLSTSECCVAAFGGLWALSIGIATTHGTEIESIGDSLKFLVFCGERRPRAVILFLPITSRIITFQQ
jgi:hypothetical protein